jgi:hypothetical protein
VHDSGDRALGWYANAQAHLILPSVMGQRLISRPDDQ